MAAPRLRVRVLLQNVFNSQIFLLNFFYTFKFRAFRSVCQFLRPSVCPFAGFSGIVLVFLLASTSVSLALSVDFLFSFFFGQSVSQFVSLCRSLSFCRKRVLHIQCTTASLQNSFFFSTFPFPYITGQQICAAAVQFLWHS